ncbi:MAG: hypothetical protein FVQ85_08245 [Planctomycetes bacterium]|nr:hypothetical protein [Planctomycetota bacterium]
MQNCRLERLKGNFAWATVKLTIWTNKIKGLHENDFFINC